MRAVIAIFSCIALAGCATTGSTVPGQLLTCSAQPPAPAGDGVSQRDVALYVIDLAEAGADCRTKLGAVRRLLTPETTK